MTSQSDNSSLVIPTNGGGFLTASFLLSFYAKMLENGLNSGVLGSSIIELEKLGKTKLPHDKQSHKQSFKLSAILDRKITRNPENYFYLRL